MLAVWIEYFDGSALFIQRVDTAETKRQNEKKLKKLYRLTLFISYRLMAVSLSALVLKSKVHIYDTLKKLVCLNRR